MVLILCTFDLCGLFHKHINHTNRGLPELKKKNLQSCDMLQVD